MRKIKFNIYFAGAVDAADGTGFAFSTGFTDVSEKAPTRKPFHILPTLAS